MDPNATLATIRRIVKIRDFQGWAEEYGEELAEAVEALDEWLSKGGFLPEAWAAKTPVEAMQRGMVPGNKLVERGFVPPRVVDEI